MLSPLHRRSGTTPFASMAPTHHVIHTLAPRWCQTRMEYSSTKAYLLKNLETPRYFLTAVQNELCLMAEMHPERLAFSSWGLHSLTVVSLSRNVHCLSKVAYSEMLFLFQTRRPSLTFSLLKLNLSWR